MDMQEETIVSWFTFHLDVPLYLLKNDVIIFFQKNETTNLHVFFFVLTLTTMQKYIYLVD